MGRWVSENRWTVANSRHMRATKGGGQSHMATGDDGITREVANPRTRIASEGEQPCVAGPLTRINKC
ncbi:hypothetical protein C4D60_Mb04t16830 [Musa balbisiana]|uniref:Uncharacterized protein n=1 Tax=Musa balbisiana TaxID=52838 RepID=A0A4S8KCJ5_MUSBA|nr:hypothetical protein C4D60_Mb04t16830 [Musa balbisiana]